MSHEKIKLHLMDLYPMFFYPFHLVKMEFHLVWLAVEPGILLCEMAIESVNHNRKNGEMEKFTGI